MFARWIPLQFFCSYQADMDFNTFVDSDQAEAHFFLFSKSPFHA